MSVAALKKKVIEAARNVKITPACENMTKSLYFSSSIFLITTTLCFIAHVVIHIYLYNVRAGTPESKEHENQVLFYWNIASTTLNVCTLLHAIWFWKSTSELNNCIIPSLLEIYDDDDY